MEDQHEPEMTKKQKDEYNRKQKKDKYHQLCLLCGKYVAKNKWKKHLLECEKSFKKARGIHGNYAKRRMTEGG